MYIYIIYHIVLYSANKNHNVNINFKEPACTSALVNFVTSASVSSSTPSGKPYCAASTPKCCGKPCRNFKVSNKPDLKAIEAKGDEKGF